MIDISDLSKAQVVSALSGATVLSAFDILLAEHGFQQATTPFLPLIPGRIGCMILDFDIAGPSFDESSYDSQWGKGEAQRALDKFRASL